MEVHGIGAEVKLLDSILTPFCLDYFNVNLFCPKIVTTLGLEDSLHRALSSCESDKLCSFSDCSGGDNRRWFKRVSPSV